MNDPSVTSSSPLPVTANVEGGPSGDRLESVDVLRGLVMIVMVLDHVREYFTDARLDPTDLSSTTPALFFTRWITHFCAPTFVLLAGVGAALAGARGKTRTELSRFLLLRGLWLILLEQTLESLFVFFAIPRVILALVLWAIGWSMIALAALIYLPRTMIGIVGIGMIALHNLLDGIQAPAGISGIAWSILHVPGMQRLPGGLPMLVGYPLIPWVGVMALGYALGPILLLPTGRRRPILLWSGLLAIAVFSLLRTTNAYGDPRPWSPRSSPIFTVMSFLNCQKYPPSLLFLLMTLGPAFVALALLDRPPGLVGKALRTIGRVPLFYYLLQWPVAHGLAVAVEASRGHPVGWMFQFPPFQSPPGYGYGLPSVYLAWAITVALLYFPCRWFAGIKRRHRSPWLSYF